MLTAGCPDGTNQTEETGTWPHDVSSPWTRNGNQEWDATDIPLRKFPSLRAVPPLLGMKWGHTGSCIAQSPNNEQIGCLSWPLSLLLGLSLHESEKCKRSITMDAWSRPQHFTLLCGNKGDSLPRKPEATNLEWAKGKSHCIYPTLWPKFWDMEKKHGAVSKKLANLGSRLSPSEKSGVIPSPRAAIPGFSTYSPWLNMDSAAVLGRIMITRDNLHVSRSIADRTQKEMSSLSHGSKSIS